MKFQLRGLMVRFVSKFKYIYFLLYSLILYSFLIIISPKENFFRKYTSSDGNKKQLVDVISTVKEEKFLLDLKYKNQLHPYVQKKLPEDLIFVDTECRVLGCKSIIYRDYVSSKFSFYLHKKLLHSFLFGSIKFIQL